MRTFPSPSWSCSTLLAGYLIADDWVVLVTGGFHSLDALLAWGFELFAQNIRYGVVLLGDYLRAHHSVRGCPFWRMMLLQVWFTTCWFWRSNGGYALDTLSLWAVLRASATHVDGKDYGLTWKYARIGSFMRRG